MIGPDIEIKKIAQLNRGQKTLLRCILTVTYSEKFIDEILALVGISHASFNQIEPGCFFNYLHSGSIQQTGQKINPDFKIWSENVSPASTSSPVREK